MPDTPSSKAPSPGKPETADLTQRWSMSYKDVNSFWDEIPFLQECLTSRKVESPAIEPGLPRREEGCFRGGLKSMA